MSRYVRQLTPHHDVNVVLEVLRSGMMTALGSSFIGLYLGGSLALGDFNPNRSDIDFITVTVSDLSNETVAALENMHSRLWNADSRWTKRLDGSYVPQQVVREWSSDHRPCPFVEGEAFYVTNQGSAVIQRHIIREYGVIVGGPSPDTLIDPVEDDSLRKAQGSLLVQWWEPLLDDPDWLKHSQKQPFAVLTMCRALYTLEYGDVTSKPVAATWAKQTVGKKWRSLIDWSLACPQDTDYNHLAPTLQFIEYAVQYYRRNYFE